MTKIKYIYLTRFLRKNCKNKKHFCDGTKLKYFGSENNQESCQYYLNKKCTNPKNPKVRGTYVD